MAGRPGAPCGFQLEPGCSSHLLSLSQALPTLGVNPNADKETKVQSSHGQALGRVITQQVLVSPGGTEAPIQQGISKGSPMIRALAQNLGPLHSVPRSAINVKVYVT